MPIDKIRKIMDEHGILTMFYMGKLFALEVAVKDGIDCSKTINVTGWTKEEVYNWLGY